MWRIVFQLSMMQDELEAASGYLHQAIRLAHQSHNNQAIIYTYSLVLSQSIALYLFYYRLF